MIKHYDERRKWLQFQVDKSNFSFVKLYSGKYVFTQHVFALSKDNK